MILCIDGWRFDVDIAATMAYSAAEAEEHCTCAYCRNFYASIDQTYPELRPFLAQFGVDIEAPAELSPYEATVCDCDYVVKGKILSVGSFEMDVGNAHILAQPYADAHLPSVLPEGERADDWFVISVMDLFLPWVLDEPMEEAESPANEPGFLRKMFDKLLGRANGNGTYS